MYMRAGDPSSTAGGADCRMQGKRSEGPLPGAEWPLQGKNCNKKNVPASPSVGSALESLCHPESEGRRRKTGLGRQAAAGTGNSAGQERCCLLSGLPFACPSSSPFLLLPGALTPEKRRTTGTITACPGRRWGQGAAEDACLGSGTANRDLGDLLEFFHGDKQGICLPLQLHHHGGTHPVGTGTGVGETAHAGRKVRQEIGSGGGAYFTNRIEWTPQSSPRKVTF